MPALPGKSLIYVVSLQCLESKITLWRAQHVARELRVEWVCVRGYFISFANTVELGYNVKKGAEYFVSL
jgi:hypothetical protein